MIKKRCQHCGKFVIPHKHGKIIVRKTCKECFEKNVIERNKHNKEIHGGYLEGYKHEDNK